MAAAQQTPIDGDAMATFRAVTMRASRDKAQRSLNLDVEVWPDPSHKVGYSKLSLRRADSNEYSDGSAFVCALDVAGGDATSPLVAHETFAGAMPYRYVVLMYKNDVLSVVDVEDV